MNDHTPELLRALRLTSRELKVAGALLRERGMEACGKRLAQEGEQGLLLAERIEAELTPIPVLNFRRPSLRVGDPNFEVAASYARTAAKIGPQVEYEV